MPVVCPSEDTTVTPDWELGGGGPEHTSSRASKTKSWHTGNEATQIPQTLSILLEIRQIFLSELFSIFSMSLGQYPGILNDCVCVCFNDFHQLYYIVVLLGEKVCRAPYSIILEVPPPRGLQNNFLIFCFSLKNWFLCQCMQNK